MNDWSKAVSDFQPGPAGAVETISGNRGLQIDIRRCDESDVYADRLGTPNPLQFALLLVRFGSLLWSGSH